MRFDEVLPRFWDRGVGDETFDPITDADIDRARSELGFELPDEYIALLRQQNGGYVSRAFDAFPTSEPTSWAEDHVWFRTLAGIGPPGAMFSVIESPGMCAEWGMPDDLVLLSGDGHFWIALDYRRTEAEPAVTWIDNEVDEDIQLASRFRDFVERLHPMDSFEDDVPSDTFEVQTTPLHVVREPGAATTLCGIESSSADWVTPGLFERSDRACPRCRGALEQASSS